MAQTPQVAFNYQVEWGGSRMGFAEVSGLDLDIAVIEYREGNSRDNSPIIIPGMAKYANVTLKRGIIASDNEFFVWVLTALHGPVERRDVTISLLDAAHQPVVRWKVRNAIPVGLRGPNLNASANEIAIEELVLAHEGFIIQHD
jgi:phage tail-like protein